MTAAFPEVQKIKYEGPQTKNPLAFRWYNESEVVEGKTMKDHLRFAVVYWHTMRGTGSDRYTVTDLFVPEAYSVLREATVKPRQPGLLYAFSSSNIYASGFAGVALGIGRSALDAFVELARDRQRFLDRHLHRRRLSV